MKKIMSIAAVFLVLFVFTVDAESFVRTGKSAVSAHLILGENNDDSIAQVGVSYEYGILPHLSAGAGYVYVDGRFPLQAHGIGFSVKGYLFDTNLDLYGKVGLQVYSSDGFGVTSTFIGGAEWQLPFKLYIGLEGGAELEGTDWGYLYGAVLGVRF